MIFHFHFHGEFMDGRRATNVEYLKPVALCDDDVRRLVIML